MSETDSDNQEVNMDVDKLDFLDSFFSESVPDISPDCPTDLFLSPMVNEAVDIPGADQTLSNAVYSTISSNNSSSIGSYAIYKMTGTPGRINEDSLGLQTPSKLKSPVNYSGENSSSSLATPEPSSGDGQVSISTPSSNLSSKQDEDSLQIKNVLPSFSLSSMNPSASSSLAESDILDSSSRLDTSNIMANVSSASCSSFFGLNQGSDGSVRPNPVANSVFSSPGPSTSTPSYLGHPSNTVHVLPSVHIFPKTIPYLDQLDYCFDSQLSPAPVPSQFSSEDLNNNAGLEVKEKVEPSPRFLPAVQVSPSPVAVLLQPRQGHNSHVQDVKPKKLRPLRPSLQVKSQDLNPLKIANSEQNVLAKDFPPHQPSPKSSSFVTNPRSSPSSAAQASSNQKIFKTDFSSFYSNSATPVPPAVQLGQNTIPLAKKRKNSAEFWNVELFEDGTEDLFIEKPKRFRDRRKKQVVPRKVIKDALDIAFLEDHTEVPLPEVPKSFGEYIRKKTVNVKASVAVLDQLVPNDKPGLIKVPSEQSGLHRSIRIASPIVSSKAKVEVKSASLVQMAKISKPKKKEEVRPDCTGCVNLRLQFSRFKDEDVEKNLGNVAELPTLCEDCGSEIALKSVERKELFDNVELNTSENKEDSLKEMSPNMNESEDENDNGKLVIDVEEVSEIVSTKDTEEGATTKSGSTTVSFSPPSLYPGVCWSCKSTKSLGSWHAHKWQPDKFLCSSCFNFYKEKNAENSKKKAILPRKETSLNHQPASISKVIAISASESELLTVPQSISSLKNLPPGTYDFSAQVETDQASVSPSKLSLAM